MGSAAANLGGVQSFVKTLHTDTYEYISSKKLDLSGKSVFITGASKGIGKETAISFATAGCSNIGIGARSDLSSLVPEIKEAARKAGRKEEPKVISVKIDVTSEDSVKAAAETISKEFGGKLDVLINNAGYLTEWVPIGNSEPEDWWRTYEVNVKGPFLCSRYFLPLLLEGESKLNIITTSGGAIAVIPSASAYQSTKFAGCRLAEFLAAEYQDQGLVAIALHPGGVRTDMADKLPAFMQGIIVDMPQLAGDTATWLASENRPWLSGRFVNSKWDMEELLSRKDEIVKKDLLKFRLTTDFVTS